MEPLSTDPYKGVRDFYPEDMARRRAMFAVLDRVLGSFGYEEYGASPLERAELYESKTSDEIVSEQTYTFVDRGDRRVTLRPEMTPTVARMVAAKRRELPFPLRWYSIPNVFRYERPQKGRLREHYQLNVDLFGLPEGEADLEIVSVAYETLTAFGAAPEDFRIQINARPLLTAACRAAGLSAESSRSYLRLLDKKDKISREEYEAGLSALGAGIDPLAVIESGSDEAVATELGKVRAFVETLRARGVINAVVDPALTRGFDYYTGIVFEVYDTHPEHNRSLFGGGRYDNLTGLFGGDAVPAVGFGMGDVTLEDFLSVRNLLPPPLPGADLYLGTISESSIPAANRIAAQLRDQGLRVFVNLTGKSIGDQVRDASRRGIPLFAAVGEEEERSERLRLKTLVTGTEEDVAVDELAGLIAPLRKP